MIHITFFGIDQLTAFSTLRALEHARLCFSVLGWGCFVITRSSRLQRPYDTAKVRCTLSPHCDANTSLLNLTDAGTQRCCCMLLCSKIFVSAVGSFFLHLFYKILFWEYKADGWVWALCVRERERMRASQPLDNKDPGCECVPFPFSSLACCFLLCLAFCQCTKYRDTDIFIWIFAAYIYLLSLIPLLLIGQCIRHNTIIIPPHLSCEGSTCSLT